jgi:hypothetical protein
MCFPGTPRRCATSGRRSPRRAYALLIGDVSPRWLLATHSAGFQAHRVTDVSETLVTYRDEATGERVGLAAADVGEWTAATASLLTSECGLGPGARVAVLLPPHWQTAVVLLGAWSAGIEVSFRGWATAGLSPAGPEVDASFVAFGRIGSWLDAMPSARHQFALFRPGAPAAARPPRSAVERPEGSAVGSPEGSAVLRPEGSGVGSPQRSGVGSPQRSGVGSPERPAVGRPLRTAVERPERPADRTEGTATGRPEGARALLHNSDFSDIPDGYRDFMAAVQPHLGVAAPRFAAGAGDAAGADGTTFGEYGALAAEIAARNGIRAGDRVLVDVSTSEQPLTWLLAPLSAGASVVLGDNIDPVRLNALIASEKITRVMR